MSIDLQGTLLGSLGQKLIRVFSPSVKRAHCGAGSNSAPSCAELFALFVDVIGAFCCINPTGRGLFRRNSRKPLALAENNVYFSVHEQFKPCQGNSSNSTYIYFFN